MNQIIAVLSIKKKKMLLSERQEQSGFPGKGFLQVDCTICNPVSGFLIINLNSKLNILKIQTVTAYYFDNIRIF